MSQEIAPLSKEQRIAGAISLLNQKELAAYKYQLASLNRKETTEIPSDRADQLYNLYLNGKTCEDIRKLNHPTYSLGQIVVARITGNWDERLQEYRETLKPVVDEHVEQVQTEASDFIADLISACHLLFKDQIKRFLQTGKKEDLKGTPLENVTFKQYQELLKTLMSVTGQENVVKTANVTDHAPTQSEIKKPDRLSPDQANNLLDELIEGNKK